MHSNITTDKLEFCKDYCKVFKEGSIQYTLKFQPNGTRNINDNFEIRLIINSRLLFFDTIYKKNRLRWIGTSLISFLQGSETFKLIVVNDESPRMLDLDLRSTTLPELYSSSRSNDTEPSASVIQLISTDLFANLSNFPPLARFSDTCCKKTFKEKMLQKIIFKSIAELKVLEIKPSNNNDNDNEGLNTNSAVIDNERTSYDNLGAEDSILDISEASLVMTCMALVLKDREKSKGNRKSRGFNSNPLALSAFYYLDSILKSFGRTVLMSNICYF